MAELGETAAYRYAEGLLAYAKKAGAEARVAEEIDSVARLYAQGGSLKGFLLSPRVPRAKKKELLSSTLGERVSTELLRFLFLLVDRGRMALLPAAAEEYRELYDRARGVVKAEVVSAVPLAQEDRVRLQAALERQTARKVELSLSVDPALIGGVIVRMENSIIDGSVKRRLEELQDLLHAVRV